MITGDLATKVGLAVTDIWVVDTQVNSRCMWNSNKLIEDPEWDWDWQVSIPWGRRHNFTQSFVLF